MDSNSNFYLELWSGPVWPGAKRITCAEGPLGVSNNLGCLLFRAHPAGVNHYALRARTGDIHSRVFDTAKGFTRDVLRTTTGFPVPCVTP
jgi:hypothetical protein